MMNAKSMGYAGLLLGIMLVFPVLQTARAFDYQQCLRDIQTRSPGIKHGNTEQACGAKARNSGQQRAVSSAYHNMTAYQRAALISSGDIAALMSGYLRSSAYKNQFSSELRDQLSKGDLKVSIFSSSTPQCRTGYTPIRPTQGIGTRHRYIRRTSPYQQYQETIKYFNVNAVLCRRGR